MIIVFMTGGASRSDVQSLVVLIPLSILTAAIAVFTLQRRHLQGHRPLFWGALAIFGLAALYVLPLPHGFWHGLPGRQFTDDIDNVVGLGQVWRPLALSPVNGWQAMASLFAPLAILILGVQLDREELYRMLPLLIGLGALSGIFGLMQAAGGPEGALYFYQITNNGSAVGLFANRNHAATLLCCLFPMLAVFASIRTGTPDAQKTRQLVAAVIAIVLVPLILVTGSRSGLLTAVIGMAGAATLYRRPPVERIARRGKKKFQLKTGPLIGGLVVLSLGFLTIFFSRAEAIDRIFVSGSGGDKRNDVWIVSRDLFWDYFPLGFGSNSFVEAFKTAEPNQILDPSYLNRAHNDWLELAVTFGVPGLLLAALAGLYYFRQSFRIWRQMDGKRRSVMFARMAGITIAIIAVASISDYPLRTPTMMCIFALMLLWFNDTGRPEASVSPRRLAGSDRDKVQASTVSPR